MDTRNRYLRHDRHLFALMGFLLGLGAPIGWLFWRALIDQPNWREVELGQFGDFYLYLTVSTVTVFSFFGYILGRHGDKVADQSDSIKDALKKVNLLAITDALTNLYNARYLHEQLLMETESAKRYHTALSCLMLDIDDFKLINDKFGHPAGDYVLTELAKILFQCVRRADVVGRLGGEEFLIIMPHTTTEAACQIAERIRLAVQRWDFKIDDHSVTVTVSIGGACYPSDEVHDKATLLKAMDNALYRAKRTGKNRTVFGNLTSI